MITNWTFSVFDELKIEGCQHIVHMPHSNVSLVPFNIAVIFRPKAGKLAVTFFVRSITNEQIVK